MTPEGVAAISTPIASPDSWAARGGQGPSQPDRNPQRSDTQPTRTRRNWMPMAGLVVAALVAGGGVWFFDHRATDAEPLAALPIDAEQDAVARAISQAIDREVERSLSETSMTSMDTVEPDSMDIELAVSPMETMDSGDSTSMVGAPDHLVKMRSTMRSTMHARHSQMAATQMPATLLCGGNPRPANRITDGILVRVSFWQNPHVIVHAEFRERSRTWTPALTRCYRGKLMPNSQMVFMDIDSQGAVTGVRLRTYCPVEPAVERCVTAIVRNERFTPDANAPGEIRFGFSPNNI